MGAGQRGDARASRRCSRTRRAWLGLSVVCLYFARRRAFLNIATGLGALLPVYGAQLAGFGWIEGMLMSRADYAARIEPNRSAVAWAAISLVVLLLAAGPPLVRSLARIRNTPGWPFLVGAGAAVVFSVAYGLARGGAEAAWLPFFGWLTVARRGPRGAGRRATAEPAAAGRGRAPSPPSSSRRCSPRPGSRPR